MFITPTILNGIVSDNQEWEYNALKKFLSATRAPLKEGKMAGAPLRHAKNLFISAVVKAGIMGATRAVWISKKHTSHRLLHSRV